MKNLDNNLIPDQVYKDFHSGDELENVFFDFFSRIETIDDLNKLHKSVNNLTGKIVKLQKEVQKNFKNTPLNILPLYLIAFGTAQYNCKYLRWRDYAYANGDTGKVNTGKEAIRHVISNNQLNKKELEKLLRQYERERILFNMQANAVADFEKRILKAKKELAELDKLKLIAED